MSWLYTLVFAGLVFSSDGSSVPVSECNIRDTPAAVENLRLDETEKFEQTYPLTANGRVSVSNVNGSVTVEGWDRNEVKLSYTKTADSRERLSDVEVRIDSKPDYFSVETDYGDWKRDRNGDRWKNNGKLTVDYRLMVPRGAVLNEIETVNGSATVSNFTNLIKVSAVNGSVNATNIRGTAKLSTVNGEVTADYEQLETGSKIALETVNGRVSLIIPSDANATVRAESLNGSISNDFGLPVRKGKYVGRDLYGRLGSGDIQIKLESVNGGLSISRKNDGKNVSPAVNLLPQKEKDDEDWDNDDNDFSGNSSKINKEVAKSVKENNKAAVKAMADAQVQIAKMKPEIAKITAESAELAAVAVQQSAEMMKTDELKQKIKDAQFRQFETMAKIAEASFFPTIPRVEKKSDSFTVKGIPKVTINARGCSVGVRGWDKSEVQYRVTQFSSPQNRTPLQVTEDHNDSTVNIRVQNPDGEARNGNFYNGVGRVRVEVFVPRKSNLKIDANGEIRLEGVSGDVELSGDDESINVRDVDGTLRVSNSDGRIRVIGFRGQIDARSKDGTINLEGDFSGLKARAVDGSITLTLPENLAADIESNCDAIRGEGIELSRLSTGQGRSKYRIGKGGANFQIDSEGEILVRSSNILNTSY